jgi:uncharacterized protein YndB with AHSA1/START domain
MVMATKILDPVEIRRVIFAQPEIVFDAWVKPELIRKWLFVGPTSEIISIEIDLKTQGKFSILELEKSNNEYIDHYGKYIEIDRPKKLAFTLSVPKHFPGETNVSVEIVATPEGSELRLTQVGVSKDVTEKSWNKMFAQLSLVLENQ